MKTFPASKLNWLGILTTAAGLASFGDALPPQAAKWLLLVAGIATVILRTFFTSQPIGGVQ